MIEIIERAHSDYVQGYTVEMLVEDIHINSVAFFDALNAMLERYKDLMDDSGKPRVAKAIDEYVTSVASEIGRRIA